MRTFTFALAALAIAGFAAPTVQSAKAETIIVKKKHDNDWYRHHHHKKVVIIKKRGDHDHDHD